MNTLITERAKNRISEFLDKDGAKGLYLTIRPFVVAEFIYADIPVNGILINTDPRVHTNMDTFTVLTRTRNFIDYDESSDELMLRLA